MAALSKLYCKLCKNLDICDVIFLDFISHKRILQVVQACVPWWSNNINTDMTKSEWVDNYSTENSFILPACEIWYLCVQKIFWANKTWTHVGTFGFCLWARRLYVSFSPPLRFNVECAFQSHTPFHAMHAWFRNRNFIVANYGKPSFEAGKIFFNEKVWLNGDFFEYFFGQMYCCPNDVKSKIHGKTFEHIFSSST